MTPFLAQLSLFLFLGMLLTVLLAGALVVALANCLGHLVALLDDGQSLLFGQGCTVQVVQHIGAVFSQDDQDPVEQVGGAGTDRLGVVLALVDHLVVVEGSDLRVMLAGDLGIQESGTS